MKSNTLNKIIFAGVVIVILLILDILFLIYTNNAINEIGTLKKQVVEESVSIKNINQTKQKTEELNIISEKIDAVLIQESEVVSFIGFIEQLSVDNNLIIDINKVDFSEPEEEGELGTIQMDFEVRGSWGEVTNFIGQIEKNTFLINTQSVRLSTFNNNGAVGWAALISLRGYTR
jgi:Tfp pilus assembly protein PilO